MEPSFIADTFGFTKIIDNVTYTINNTLILVGSLIGFVVVYNITH